MKLDFARTCRLVYSHALHFFESSPTTRFPVTIFGANRADSPRIVNYFRQSISTEKKGAQIRKERTPSITRNRTYSEKVNELIGLLNCYEIHTVEFLRWKYAKNWIIYLRKRIDLRNWIIYTGNWFMKL